MNRSLPMPSRRCVARTLALAVAVVVAATGLAHADGGVDGARIAFGQSGSFTGIGAGPARAARAGVRAAFDEVNARGGVHGRRLELESLDDGYDPERALANTRKLVEGDGVFAMIASFGTPTSEAVLPMLARSGIPYLGPISGAAFLREPGRDNVVNLRPGYDDEAAAWVRGLREDLRADRVAILHQNDAFGRAGLDSARSALARAGMEPVAEAAFERGTVAVKQALLKIRRARPDAVLMVAPARPIAAFVRTARQLGMRPAFMTVSLIDPASVFDALGGAAAGIVFTQVVPSLEDGSVPAVGEYRRALAASDPGAVPHPVGLEAYLTGRLVAERLDALGPTPARRALLDDIAALGDHDLGGIPLHFGPGDNQGIARVYLSVLGADGELDYVDRLERADVRADVRGALR